MKLLITGICGFVGSAIAKSLLAADRSHQIHGFDNFIRPGSESNRAELKALGIEPVIGSLDDRELLIAQAKAADGVINAASSDHRGVSS